jgi:S-adenosylmethionine/arginine decarboxylase-like enzyme
MIVRRYQLSIDGTSHTLNFTLLQLIEIIKEIADLAEMRIFDIVGSNIELHMEGKENNEDEGGISILAGITTSHITIHYWPMTGAFMFDLVSCKEFNKSIIAAAVNEYMKTSNIDFQQTIPHDTQTDSAIRSCTF